MGIDSIINSMAQEKYLYIIENGRLEGGHNGPYHDKETSCRVEAHWIIIFSSLLEKDKKYIEAVRILADDICSQQEDNGIFLCRNKKGKDSINGVIGAAWCIEGLIQAAKVLHDDKYYEYAHKTFMAFPFNDKIGLWNRREVDGTLIGYDTTYNHQLWFAAAGALICSYKKDDEIERRVFCFLQRSNKTFYVFNTGLTYQCAVFGADVVKKLKAYKRLITEIIKRSINKPSLQYKEEGYHYFTMFGFALIHRYYPGNPFFSTSKFKKALEYTFDFGKAKELQNNVPERDGMHLAQTLSSECNVYGFSYNSPAFELPLLVSELSDSDYDKEICELMDIQLSLTYDDETRSFCRNTEDSVTLDARIYEYIRSSTI